MISNKLVVAVLGQTWRPSHQSWGLSHAYLRVRRRKYIHTCFSTRSSLGTCTVLRQRRKTRRRRKTVLAPLLAPYLPEPDLPKRGRR